MIAVSNKMIALLNRLEILARFNFSLWLHGESGTGKSLLAAKFAELKGLPFLAVNCSCLAPELAGNELFGSVKGAFTGALGKKGLLSHKGILLLDEICDLPLPVQAQLLLAVESKRFTPLGSLTSEPVNCLIVAASSKDVWSLIADKLFRLDLFQRLAQVELTVSPLRERKSDILPIAQAFLEALNAEYGLTISLPSLIADKLLASGLVGNVREVQRIVREAFVNECLNALPNNNKPCMVCGSLDSFTGLVSFTTDWLCKGCAGIS